MRIKDHATVNRRSTEPARRRIGSLWRQCQRRRALRRYLTLQCRHARVPPDQSSDQRGSYGLATRRHRPDGTSVQIKYP